MGRIIVANRRGHQLVEWDAESETDEAREGVLEAERILREAREKGCAVSKKVGTQHVLDDGVVRPVRRGVSDHRANRWRLESFRLSGNPTRCSGSRFRGSEIIRTSSIEPATPDDSLAES